MYVCLVSGISISRAKARRSQHTSVLQSPERLWCGCHVGRERRGREFFSFDWSQIDDVSHLHIVGLAGLMSRLAVE